MDNLELLEQLGVVEPPALHVTSRVAAALDGAASAVSTPSRHRRRRTSVHASPWTYVTAAFVVLLVAAVTVVTNGGGLTSPLTSSWSPGHTFSTTGGVSRHGNWALMDDDLTGTWEQDVVGPPPGYETCPDQSTCFVMSGRYTSDAASAATSEALYSSTDFGSSWTVFPMPSGFVATSALVCSDATNCAAGGTYKSQPVLVTTGNSGHTFTVSPLPSNVGTMYSLSCPSNDFCDALVATHLDTNGEPVDATELSTSDGGAHFTDRPILSGDSMKQIDCSSVSACTVIGQNDAGTDEWTSGVSAVTGNGGQSWNVGAFPQGFGVDFEPQISCADALHCSALGTIEISVVNASVCGSPPPSGPAASADQSPAVSAIAKLEYQYAVAALKSDVGNTVTCTTGGNGELVVSDVAATSDGGRTWTPEALPSDVPEPLLSDISCPSARECWISGSAAIPQTVGTSPQGSVTDGGSSVLLGTANDGLTWSRVEFSVPKGAPNFEGQSFLSVGSISCPTANDCAAHGTAVQNAPSAPIYTLRIPTNAS